MPHSSQPRKRVKISTRTISRSNPTPKHPLNVRPSGNALLATGRACGLSRGQQMGYLNYPDELLMDILGLLDEPKDVMRVGHCSRVLYAFTYDEELWRKLYTKKAIEEEDEYIRKGLESPKYPMGIDKWRGSWRGTLLGVSGDSAAQLQSPDNLIFSDILYRPFQCSQVNYEEVLEKIIAEEERSSKLGEADSVLSGRISRVNESSLTLDIFNKEWVDKPFIITNRKKNRWPEWDLSSLLRRFPDVRFRQESVKWPLSFYSEYFNSNQDESPLYLFDCSSEAMKELVREYEVPKCFQHDFFKVFDEDPETACRPDHAWIIVGPKRSGSTFHKDPNRTSAWNVALTGRKLWVMLPPNVQPPGVGTDSEESEVTSPVGIAEWILSGFFNDAVKLSESGNCLIGITHPGECMYVPSGWWHSVINIDDSVAITQNFSPIPKLAHVLNFFKNKPDQLSGFKPVSVRSKVEAVLKKNEQTPFKQTFESYLEETVDLLSNHLAQEDCGETIGKGDVTTMPVFELFQELLTSSGYHEELSVALLELKKMETDARREMSVEVHRSEMWDKLTGVGEEQPATFSFGFEESDENDDI